MPIKVGSGGLKYPVANNAQRSTSAATAAAALDDINNNGNGRQVL